MVFFAAAFMWAYPAKSYRENGLKRHGAARAIIDSLNYCKYPQSLLTPYIHVYSQNSFRTHQPISHVRYGARSSFSSIIPKTSPGPILAIIANEAGSGYGQTRSAGRTLRGRLVSRLILGCLQLRIIRL